jgi:hypothetical protein
MTRLRTFLPRGPSTPVSSANYYLTNYHDDIAKSKPYLLPEKTYTDHFPSMGSEDWGDNTGEGRVLAESGP